MHYAVVSGPRRNVFIYSAFLLYLRPSLKTGSTCTLVMAQRPWATAGHVSKKEKKKTNS